MAQSQKAELQIQKKSSGKIDFEHLESSDAVNQLQESGQVTWETWFRPIDPRDGRHAKYRGEG